MTCSHVFQRTHLRRVMTDRTGCDWYIIRLRCRHCGYTEVEYRMVDTRPPKPKPLPKRKNMRRIPPQEQKRMMLRRRMRKLGL
jgi:hypothetical protein